MAKVNRLKRDKYWIDGKDPDKTYKFVGQRHYSNHHSEGWIEVLKEENPKIKVPGDINKSKTGVFDNGAGILMMLPIEAGQDIKDMSKEQNDSRMAAVKKDCKNFNTEQVSLKNS